MRFDPGVDRRARRGVAAGAALPDLIRCHAGTPPRLLVSVRTAAEARAALDGGAEIIDVKEPARGPLGRADARAIAAVVREVAGRAPVTAALGELAEWVQGPRFSVQDRKGLSPPARGPRPAGAALVKFGLSGLRRRSTADWQQLWRRGRGEAGGQAVLVAYADAERAAAPPVDEVVGFAADVRPPVLLIDTFVKDGRTLLDWLDVDRVAEVVAQAHCAGVAVALAGSLSRREIALLLPAGADVIAVRGAACGGGRRDGAIDPAAVADLARVVKSPGAGVAMPAAVHGS